MPKLEEQKVRKESFSEWLEGQANSVQINRDLDIARVEGFYSGVQKTLQSVSARYLLELKERQDAEAAAASKEDKK